MFFSFALDVVTREGVSMGSLLTLPNARSRLIFEVPERGEGNESVTVCKKEDGAPSPQLLDSTKLKIKV